MSTPSLPRRLGRFLADRAGVSSLVFAGSSFALVGAVALAADVSTWYLTRRAVQNTADAAAAAGAVTAGAAGVATAAAREVSGRNGFAHNPPGGTTVAVNEAHGSGGVEVVVSTQQPPGLALVFGVASPVVSARAVARLTAVQNICGLSLNGALTVTGSAIVNAPGCVLASNKQGADSIVIGSGSNTEVTAATLIAAGQCNGCTPDPGRIDLASPPRSFAPRVPNPFSYLHDNSFSPNLAPAGTIEPFEANGRVINGNMRFTGSGPVNLVPGTYVIWNGNFEVRGTATVQCPTCTAGRGVTIVLTGNPGSVGQISINANTTVNLAAPDVGPVGGARPWNPEWRGVLFYRDAAATNNSGTITINGTATSTLTGAMYFPTSTVRFLGNAATGGCSLVVAGTLTMSGNSETTMCATAYAGLPVPTSRRLEFIE